MASKTIATKLNALESKLNTFATLVNDNKPEYRETLEAVYKELEELKALAKDDEPKEVAKELAK